MKKLFLILSFIYLHTYTMEVIPPIKSLLPEILLSIFKLSLQPMNLYYDKEPKDNDMLLFPDYNSGKKDQQNGINATCNLHGLVTAIMRLRHIDKHFNIFINQNIHALLDINKNNINAFLIRSTQANIPYFMKIAFNKHIPQDEHKTNEKILLLADPNFVHKSDGNTPFLFAMQHNKCYAPCAFLIENGADVNKNQQSPVAGYSFNPDYALPICKAVKQQNPALITLLAQNGADLTIEMNNAPHYTLLSVAAQNNNPLMLKTLLDLGLKHWGYQKVDHALQMLPQEKTHLHIDRDNKAECKKLLQERRNALAKMARKACKQYNLKNTLL